MGLGQGCVEYGQRRFIMNCLGARTQGITALYLRTKRAWLREPQRRFPHECASVWRDVGGTGRQSSGFRPIQPSTFPVRLGPVHALCGGGVLWCGYLSPWGLDQGPTHFTQDTLRGKLPARVQKGLPSPWVKSSPGVKGIFILAKLASQCPLEVTQTHGWEVTLCRLGRRCGAAGMRGGRPREKAWQTGLSADRLRAEDRWHGLPLLPAALWLVKAWSQHRRCVLLPCHPARHSLTLQRRLV